MQMVGGCTLVIIFSLKEMIFQIVSPRSSPPQLNGTVRIEWVEAGSEQEARLLAQMAAHEERRSLTEAGADPEVSAAFILMLSYADMLSDLVLAILLISSSHSAFGWASICIIGFSLLVQVLMVKFVGEKPWVSKDILLTTLCLGPVLQAYRDAFGEPARHARAQPARNLLAMLKGVEVAFESLPEMVLSLTLLARSSAAWSWGILFISLGISAVAASILIVDAERSVNAAVDNRRMNQDYFGYLPSRIGFRRYALLLFMMLFAASYLLLAASCIAVATALFSNWAVLAVLAADCGLHHVTRAAEGEWWIVGDAVRSGGGTFAVDLVVNTILWSVARVCPVPLLRDPFWCGPRTMARIVVSSLLEGAFVISAALMTLTPENPARAMAAWICLPSLCVALMALASFYRAISPYYRRTFWARDSREAMHRRRFKAWAELGPSRHADIAHFIADGNFPRYVGEPVTAWIEQHAAEWTRQRPAWFTAEWRDSVKRHAHLLPGDGAARVVAVLPSQPTKLFPTVDLSA
jgi:hypothetical protein